MVFGISLNLATAGILSLVSYAGTAAAQLPVVDLGYARYRASSYDTDNDFYGFEGIRYASSPTGNLRFRKPHPPKKDRSVISDGSDAKNCITASNSWNAITNVALPNYLAGKPFGVTRADLRDANDTSDFQYSIPDSEAEDCLFLNVATPGTALNSTKGKGAPVLVWIYGGGYVLGNRKDVSGIAGLLRNAKQNNPEGFVYVSMNYRLGAFGWLAGPTVEKDGVANAGLYDQRFALNWVRKYIQKFGGDPDRVTVWGESAGAGSILHQITAFGGKGADPPFQRAIIQSPGFHQQNSRRIRENQYNRFLQLTNAQDLSELRQLPIETLASANAMQVFQSEYGYFTYGPAVDTAFVPALPGQLLLRGQYHKNIRVIAAHNTNEGLGFADPFVKTQRQFKSYTSLVFPSANQRLVNHIAEDLYPPSYSGDEGYSDPFARSAKMIKENAFACATYALGKAFGKKAYSYEFAVYPALHGDDVSYSYWDGNSGSVANTTIATALQDYITTFTQTGRPSSPNVPGAPAFPAYSSGSGSIYLDTKNIRAAKDAEDNARCDFWVRSPFAR